MVSAEPAAPVQIHVAWLLYHQVCAGTDWTAEIPSASFRKISFSRDMGGRARRPADPAVAVTDLHVKMVRLGS